MLEKVSPVINWPDGSIGWLNSWSRHMPSALKFSSARPGGSIWLWQEAHKTFSRCTASVSRNVGARLARFFTASSSGGTFGGGGSGGVPKMLSRMKRSEGPGMEEQ